MKLKPRSTTQNRRALLYKLFINMEQSYGTLTAYSTQDNKLWLFNAEKAEFVAVAQTALTAGTRITAITNFTSVVKFKDKYFRYNGNEWQEIEDVEANVDLLSASFNNVAKYQTNKYYYVGSFDFMVKGGIEDTTTQYLNGNIIEVQSLNIRHFDDSVHLSPDDLVVVDGRLYSVENPETVQKRMPEPFNVYFATLNSIL